MASMTTRPTPIAAAFTFRRPSCTGRCSACRNSSKMTRRRRRIGSCRSSSRSRSRPTRTCSSACIRRSSSASPIAQEMLALRDRFLSRTVYQTYNGYVLSQFKKLQADLRNKGEVKWKHVMHLIRLLLAGIETLKTSTVPVRVDEHRETLLSIKRGERKWEDLDQWRLQL